ncbi:MAG: hypothetical protein HY243_15935 [Proteobacteria bacterium]|nr:hypothetical protein [Pseudomonadota bacterium]
MTNTPETPTIPLIDNPLAPDIYADGLTGFFVVGNSLRMTLESVRANYTKAGAPPVRVVVGRLNMQIDRAEDLAKSILNLVAQHKAQASAPAPQGTPTVN